MADLQRMLVVNFEGLYDQWATSNSPFSAGDITLPPCLSAVAHDSNEPPVIVAKTSINYQMRGLHSFPDGSANNNECAVLYDTALAPSTDLISFVRMRAFGNVSGLESAHFNAGPATRIDSGGTNCYAVEIRRSGGAGTAYSLLLVKYTAGVKSTLATLSNAITEYPASSANFNNRFFAIGIKATNNGPNVDLEAYLITLYFTETPSAFTTVNLDNLSGSYAAVLTATDSSSPFTSGAHGIKWHENATVVSTPTDTRIVSQWGLFKGISSTRPTTPSISSYTPDNGQRLTVTIDGFSDTDGLDTHYATRWLLYDDDRPSPNAEFAAPLVDTGFLTGSKLSYTFADLTPGRQYHVRAQVQDNDGDVSDFAEATGIRVGDPLTGYIAAVDFYEKPSELFAPKNNCFSFAEQGAYTGSTPYKLEQKGSGASSKHGYAKRFGTVSPGAYKRFAWRDERYITGGSDPLYLTTLATMVFLNWAGSTGYSIGVRCTAADADGLYIRKAASGANWQYTVVVRTLNAGGSLTTGPWTETTIGTFTIAKTKLSANGERVLLVHSSVASVRYLALYVNGILLGVVNSGSYSQLNNGYTDPGHEWCCIMEDSTGATVEIQQYGQIAITGNMLPSPDLEVYPFTRVTGSGIHHPGPYMDPFDLNEADNCWWQQTGSFYFRSGSSGTPASYAFLVYWAPILSSYDYTVKAEIYGDNGVVARFTDPENYFIAYLVGGTVIEVEQVTAGVVTTLETITGITYSAGAELMLFVANDANSQNIFLRVYYNGVLVSTGSYLVAFGAQSTHGTGRPGIARTSGVTGTTAEQVASSFLVVSAVTINPPNTPTIESKSGDATIKVSVQLTADAFSDPDFVGTHAKSQWQIRLPSAATIFDSGETATHLTSITVTASLGTWSGAYASSPGLNSLTQYEARVRYKDSLGLWSDWSDWFLFTTGNPATTTAINEVLETFPTGPIPSQTFSETVTFRTIISPFETGREQRRGKGTREKYSFKLVYDKRERTEIDVLWDFYIDQQGSLGAFNFQHPITGINYICRFVQDSMSREIFEYNIENTGLELVEVI